MKKYTLLLSFFLLFSCNSDKEESIRFYDNDYYNAVISELDKVNIPYRATDKNTIVFSISNREKIKNISNNVYSSITPLFIVYGDSLKEKISIILEQNDIAYSVKENQKNEYGFVIKDKEQNNNALLLFKKALEHGR